MGAILERVDYEMGRVLDNILDPNTKPTGKRKITISLELVPSLMGIMVPIHNPVF